MITTRGSYIVQAPEDIFMASKLLASYFPELFFFTSKLEASPEKGEMTFGPYFPSAII